MKKLALSLLGLLVLGGVNTHAQTKFSILGDSYSTFEGCVTPAWNFVWYSPQTPEKVDNDVNDVNQTWWKLLDNTDEYQLEKNNSWSGSTICLTGYSANDYADRAFITRVQDLGKPDVILVFGGTNDSWAGSPIGDYQYWGWTNEDLYSFRPAMAFMLENLKRLYPQVRIVNILNSELKDEINESVITICDHYGVENITLTDVEKGAGHPTQKGMQSIFEQVKTQLDNNAQLDCKQ